MSFRTAMEKGNVVRESFPGTDKLPLYLGSGVCGACFDGWGLMNDGTTSASTCEGTRYGEAMRLTHKDCYRHGNYGIDCWLGMYRLCFADGLPALDKDAPYRQTLNLYDGCLRTSYVLSDGTRVTLRAGFHPYCRDVLALDVNCVGSLPDLLLKPETDFCASYGQNFRLSFDLTTDGFVLHTGTVDVKAICATVCRAGDVALVHDRAGIRVHALPVNGRVEFTLLIGACGAGREADVARQMDTAQNSPDWMETVSEGWHKRYGNAYVDLPDTYTAMMWARSLYYVLSSFAPDDGIPSAPMGWTGYGWYFHFPQDISYIHPALLRLGHVDIAKSIVEFYRRTLDTMQVNTTRIYGGRGVMWAWEYPINNTPDLLLGGAPNPFQFEIHNAAYPARMAYETAVYLGDPEWTESVAVPIIRASAEFYASHLIRENSGRWSLHVVPAMSQDENAKPNQKNYLCALYSARYTFTVAVKCGMTEYERYLADGLSFDRLYCAAENLYYTSEGMTCNDWGMQKHPVQLCPLTFLPADRLDGAEVNAYECREFICPGLKVNHIDGWTLASCWLAEAHRGDGEDLIRDIHKADRDDYSDPERLSYYETSGVYSMPYYITTHGFLLQAVCDAFVNPYGNGGKATVLGAVPEAWRGAVYENLRDARDVAYSGKA